AEMLVIEMLARAKRMREHGTTLAGGSLADPPRFLIGAADVPLADPYDPAKLEAKLDAGADFVITQIVYDVPALAAWADAMRARGLFDRAHVLIGMTPLRSARQARYMDEKLPGVTVPPAMIAALESAGDDAESAGGAAAGNLIEENGAFSGISAAR